MRKVLEMFVEDEFTGLMVPNRRVRSEPLYFLCTEGGGIKCTLDWNQAVTWLNDAVDKSGNLESHWIEEI